MTRHFVAFAASLTMATALVVAQGQQNPPPPTPDVQVPADTPQKPAPEVALTGCLIQGTGPTVFILDNAKLTKAEPTEPGKTYMLVIGTEDLNFETHLNHEVTITGAAELKTVPTPEPGQKVDEKDLPKLTAKSVTMIADKCTTPIH